MMAGTDRDAHVIQYGGGVVRMHPVDVEADDSGAVLGTVERDPADIRQCRAGFGDERAFMGVDRVHPDRLNPVDPTTAPKLDPNLLAQFPEGDRHLAYMQTRVGYAVKRDMPGLDGPEVEALYEKGAKWLRGEKL